jgi:hypothetical protein
MTTEDLAPLAGYPEVVTALEAFRTEPVEAFKASWRNDFSRLVADALGAKSPQDLWSEGQADVWAYEWLEFYCAVAEQHEDLAPNPYDLKQYESAKVAAGKAGEGELERAFAHGVLYRLADHQYWLAWDLFRADLKSPLLGRRAEAEAMIAKVPHMIGEWSDTELTIKLATDCPYLADSGSKLSGGPLTIKLRPKQ